MARAGKGDGKGGDMNETGSEASFVVVASRPPLACWQCKTTGKADQFVAESTTDWQESILAICMRCWLSVHPGKSERDFGRASNASWKKRSSNTKQQTRVTNFKQVLEENPREADESAKAHRRRLHQTVGAMAAQILYAFKMMDEARRSEALKTLGAFHLEGEQVVRDGTYIPLLSGAGSILENQVNQFLSGLCEGVDQYFLCRTVGCGYFSLSHNWAFNT